MPIIIITTIIALSLAIYASYKSFTSYSPLPLLLLCLFPVGIFMINNLPLWLGTTIALYASTLKIPGTPANLNLFHIFSAGFALLVLLYRIVNKDENRLKHWGKFFSVALILIIAYTMALRGAGLRVLGSNLWGGGFYVILLIAIFFYLSAEFIPLKSSTWHRTLIIMCLLAFLPLIAQLIYVLSGGNIWQQYHFIKPAGFIASTLEAVEDESGIARFTSNATFFLLLLPFLFFKRPFQGLRFFLTIAILLGAIFLTSLSGSRYSVILCGLFLAVYAAFKENKIVWIRSAFVFLLFLAGIAILALFAPQLPIPVQRAISWVPYADIDFRAMADATATANWRLDLWRQALPEVPKHLLIGKGFAFDPVALQALQLAGAYSDEWALVTHSYHNGPLSLLLIFGLPGFVAGFGFLFYTLYRHLKIFTTQAMPEQLMRMYGLILAVYISRTALFILIGGDTQNFFPALFFLATLLECFANTIRHQNSPASPN